MKDVLDYTSKNLDAVARRVLDLPTKKTGGHASEPDEETRARFDEQDAAKEKPAPKREPATPASVLDRMLEHGPAAHIATGLDALDELTGGGPCLGDLVVVMGAPDAWKTNLLLQCAEAMSERGVVVGIVCADEDDEQLVTRSAQRRGWKRAEVEQRIEFEKLRALLPSMWLYDDMWTLESAFADFVTRADGKPAAFFADSAQTVMLASPIAIKGERERVAEVVRFLRVGARVNRVLVLVTSEMTRASYSGDEQSRTDPMAAGKWTSNIEYFAKILVALRNVKDESDLIACHIAKNKRGKSRVDFFLRGDRVAQKLIAAEAPATAKKTDRSDAARAKVLEDAVAVVKLLRLNGARGSTDIRAALRAKHGTFSTDRVITAIAFCRDGIRVETAKKGARLHHVELAALPVVVLAALGPSILSTLPPDVQTKVRAFTEAPPEEPSS